MIRQLSHRFRSGELDPESASGWPRLRSSYAYRLQGLPLPCLQPAFQVNMPAFIQVFPADLSQPAKANNLEPLHSLARSTLSVLPPFVNCKAKRTDGGTFW